MKKELLTLEELIIYFASRVIGLILSLLVTCSVAPYFIAGVNAERGYSAVGGEYIMLVLVCACCFYSFAALANNILLSCYHTLFE